MRLGFEAVLDRREGVLLWGDKGTSDEADLFGRFNVREGGWRIRSNPDGPSPCSCSSREDLQYIKIRSQYRCFCTITCNIPRNARGSVKSTAASLISYLEISYPEERLPTESFIDSSRCKGNPPMKDSDSGDSESGPKGDDKGLGSPIDLEILLTVDSRRIRR
jgi:hypothetical protein